MTSSGVTAWRAAGVYVLAALAMSWPLPVQLGSAMPGDLGDPVLNAWILAWGADHVTAILGGDLGAFAGWWNANIFHPSPLALAYSEHLTPQVLMGLPIWWATGNVLLVYNLLYLASTVLSGLGTFLLVRELTGQPRAALVAGLFFAFVPYRIAQIPHLQVLSSQWMPFVLFACRRYIDRGHPGALAGAVAALVAQQLSCGYYLIYFTPFVAMYLVWEVTARRRWRDLRLLASIAAAAVVDIALTWPFLSPYLQLRSLGFPARSLREVAEYSADTRAYLVVHETNRVWSRVLESLPRAENELFPGVLPVVLAGVGLVALARWRWSATSEIPAEAQVRRWIARASLLIAATSAVAVIAFVMTGAINLRVADVPLLRVRSIGNALGLLGAGLVGTLVASRRARAWCAWGPDLRVCALLALTIAVVLSWGPDPRAGGRPLNFTGPYLWLYTYVPGFDGLRVPARLAMVAYVFLAVLGGYGLGELDRRRHGVGWMTGIALLFLVEATGVPIPVGENAGTTGVPTPPPVVFPAHRAPPVYKFLATLPPRTVVAELPFGYQSWELRYVYYSAVHRQRLVNGYSGGFPGEYMVRAALLMDPLKRPDRAWNALISAGATHVVVHQSAYRDGQHVPVGEWLESRGARRIASFRADHLYELPR